MPMSIQDLRERRSARAKSLHDLLEDNPSDKWNDELQTKYDEGMAEINDLDAAIDRHGKLAAAMADEHQQGSLNDAADRLEHDDKSPTAALYAKWLRGGDNALSAEDWSNIRATMSTTTGSEGGYTVQTEVAQQVADALKAYGGMREVATVIQTAQGNPMNFPTSDGTAEEGELVAENTTATDADATFGVLSLDTYKFSSKTVAVPIELLQDSAVDIEAFVNQRLVDRIGRITNKKFTIGTGASEPRGVSVAAAAGKVGATGQTTSVIVDDLIDLLHSVDPAYRENPACSFMLHDDSFRDVRKIKDSNGRPIFLPGYDGLGGAMPDTILGKRVVINQHVATMAASAKSILFGDFSKYIIRDVLQMQLHRFTDSAYAKLGQVGFLMFSRHAGNLVDVGGAVKYYQNSAT